MKTAINLEETPGKVVGRSTASVEDYDRLVDASAEVMPRLPIPKGVFRFRTHEQADKWLDHHILQAALKKARAHRDAAT